MQPPPRRACSGPPACCQRHCGHRPRWHRPCRRWPTCSPGDRTIWAVWCWTWAPSPRSGSVSARWRCAFHRAGQQTCGALAEALGGRHMARAVGQALEKNPFAPTAPCDRVLAAQGRPGGSSAHGGSAMKLRMLASEGWRPASAGTAPWFETQNSVAVARCCLHCAGTTPCPRRAAHALRRPVRYTAKIRHCQRRGRRHAGRQVVGQLSSSQRLRTDCLHTGPERNLLQAGIFQVKNGPSANPACASSSLFHSVKGGLLHLHGQPSDAFSPAAPAARP